MPNCPNIILIMTDDQGWGDVAYNGNPIVRTPHLDAMAREGIRLDRFYAAAPVCSPTRASCLTGRHPFRVNIPWAGDGHLPIEETTIAKALQSAGYGTGHFGKWHVGQLSKTLKQSEFPIPADPARYAPPWLHGFDACFSTESMVPTYNPYYHDCGPIGSPDYRMIMDKPVAFGDTSGVRWNSLYWTGPGQFVDDNLPGDDASLIVDRALDHAGSVLDSGSPFFSCIWFHAPHTPVVAGNDMRALYPDLSIEEQHWFGCLSALDAQVGRVRRFLRDRGIEEETLIWFCSDNGPSYVHDYNSAGPFRGKKASLLEGGIRVPGIVEWPGHLPEGSIVNAPLCTSDFYPTLLGLAGVRVDNQPVLDGIDVLPILEGRQPQRNSPIGFQSPLGAKGSGHTGLEHLQMAWTDDQFKLITLDTGASWQLYELEEDPSESRDLSDYDPTRVESMKRELEKWRTSCDRSACGLDYATA